MKRVLPAEERIYEHQRMTKTDGNIPNALQIHEFIILKKGKAKNRKHKRKKGNIRKNTFLTPGNSTSIVYPEN